MKVVRGVAMKSACSFCLFVCLITTNWAQSPVPLIEQPLVPTSATPGGSAFTLTVNGTGFVPTSVVNWNGHARITQFVSNTKLTAAIPASDITKAGTASVSVVNLKSSNETSNVAFFSVVTPVASVAFTGSNFPAFGNPVAVVVGDFNGDGKLDLAMADWTVSTVAILLGNGDGTLQPAVSYATGAGVDWIAIGDFNGDGKLDLATTNYSSNSVSILMGNGDGTFRGNVDYTTDGSHALVVVSGDFNGDGKLDLAVGSSSDKSIFLGNGDGTFQARTLIDNTMGFGACIGDFNGDGILDLGFVNFGSDVWVYLGKGNGTFQQGVLYPSGQVSDTVATADLNGDGHPDLVIGNDDGATVLIGKGNGTFGPPTSYLTSIRAFDTSIIADVNGDGKPDIAVANSSADTISILLGNGDGTFQLSPYFQSGLDVQSLATGDFNNDGAMDLALSAYIGMGILHRGTAFISLQTNGPAVLFSQAELTFPIALVGTQSAPVEILMTNVGKESLDITRIGMDGANANAFTQTNNCGARLAVGVSCDIDVSFAPKNRGPRVASLVVGDNAINHQQSIPLSGTGTWVGLSPTSLSFGSQAVGTVSASQIITLTNVGNEPVSVYQVGLTGPSPQEFLQTNSCGATVAAGASCVINVQFAPTKRASFTDNIEVKDNGGGLQQKAPLTGTGT